MKIFHDMTQVFHIRWATWIAVLAACFAIATLAPAELSAERARLAPEWRVHFIPAKPSNGGATCHSHRGTFRIDGDLNVSGRTEAWTTKAPATLSGRVTAGPKLSADIVRAGAVVGRSEGRLASRHGSGSWRALDTGCTGTWVAEPIQRQRLSRPAYAEPDGCSFSGSADQRICTYNLDDGTQRAIVMAQDIFGDRDFRQTFGGAPPGFDRPDLAREVLTLFVSMARSDLQGATGIQQGFVNPEALPYGALACRKRSYRQTGTDSTGSPIKVSVQGLWCFQPLANEKSRFTALQVMEKHVGSRPGGSFKQDAEAILSSLRLP